MSVVERVMVNVFFLEYTAALAKLRGEGLYYSENVVFFVRRSVICFRFAGFH